MNSIRETWPNRGSIERNLGTGGGCRIIPVDISLNTRLSAVTAEEALLNDGTRVPTNTVVATIGGTPNPVLQALACEHERGRIVVDAFLEVPGHPGVWAVGDCAHIIDAKKGTPCPPTAQYAVREGKCLAENILAAIDGREKRPFSFSTLGMMGALGHQNAVGSVLGIRISGILAWFIWRTIYWTKLPGFSRKFKVAISWVLNFIFRHDIAHLNVTPTQDISREHFEAGKVVFREGDPGDRVYIIVDGEAEAVRQSDDGSEKVLTKMEKGECFGEIALITEAPRTATVRTVTNLDVISLHRASFGTLFGCLPQLRDAFERMMDERKSRDEERKNNSNQS
jgi:NADH dehydrogenase